MRWIRAEQSQVASLLFAVIDPDVTYWAFAFPSTALSVFGADFIYATSTIYIASIAEKGEQGLTSGLFQVFSAFLAMCSNAFESC